MQKLERAGFRWKMARADCDFFLWFVRVSTWPWPCPYVVGDLAFQVQFGQFSEEQRDRIMEVLTTMFCYKHSKVKQLYCKFRWSTEIIQILINEKFSLRGVKRRRGSGKGRIPLLTPATHAQAAKNPPNFTPNCAFWTKNVVSFPFLEAEAQNHRSGGKGSSLET